MLVVQLVGLEIPNLEVVASRSDICMRPSFSSFLFSLLCINLNFMKSVPDLKHDTHVLKQSLLRGLTKYNQDSQRAKIAPFRTGNRFRLRRSRSAFHDEEPHSGRFRSFMAGV